MRSLRVTVMLGGPSAEREVSLRSGGAVARALESLGHRVTLLDPVEADWSIDSASEVVFLALHGTYGEDGQVQERLEKLQIPFTGCDAVASRMAFDKVLAKGCFQAHGLPTPRFGILRGGDRWPSGWYPPVVLKPARQGSSVGLAFVDRAEDWEDATREAFRFDHEVLMEERIIGREVTVGVLGREVLPIVEVRPLRGSYDYANKYTAGATEYDCPASFESPVTRRIQDVGWAAFESVGGRDYGRVDIIVDPSGQPWVLEVNTLPGMTETSLFPKAAMAFGLPFPSLCQRMLEMALARAADGKKGKEVARAVV